MNRWEGIEIELRGIKAVAKNTHADAVRVGAYVVDRACAYMGADHEGMVARLVTVAIDECVALRAQRAEGKADAD